MAQLNSRAFGPEAQLARILESEVHSVRVDTRSIPNVWKENAKSAIIGNSFELSGRKDILYLPGDTYSTGVFNYTQHWIYMSGEYHSVPLLGGGSIFWRSGTVMIETRAPMLSCKEPEEDVTEITDPFSLRRLPDGSKALRWGKIDIARVAPEVTISKDSKQLVFHDSDRWFCL